MRTSPLRLSGVDKTVLPANTPYLPLPRSSPEGATTEWTVIAPADEAYCSLIDPTSVKGCWLTCSGRFIHINGYPTAAGPVQTSESSPVRDRRSTNDPPNQPVVVVVVVVVAAAAAAYVWFEIRVFLTKYPVTVIHFPATNHATFATHHTIQIAKSRLESKQICQLSE